MGHDGEQVLTNRYDVRISWSGEKIFEIRDLFSRFNFLSGVFGQGGYMTGARRGGRAKQQGGT
jgi:hypothetical protein